MTPQIANLNDEYQYPAHIKYKSVPVAILEKNQ